MIMNKKYGNKHLSNIIKLRRTCFCEVARNWPKAKGRSPTAHTFPFPPWRNSQGKEGNGGNHLYELLTSFIVTVKVTVISILIAGQWLLGGMPMAMSNSRVFAEGTGPKIPVGGGKVKKKAAL